MTLNPPEKLVLSAAALLFAVGSALAIARPGDLGGRDSAAPAAATSTTSTTTSTTVPATTTSTMGDAPTPAIEGSGLGTSTPPTGGVDGVAQTGMESMLGVGLGLLGLGLGLRRVVRPVA
ncbi:MAG: hypothetical protein ACT4OV_01070 [Microthrixaceae bacterium]